jgi:hypothetical protein
MTDGDDYCDFCDLPKSQCIHGQPPPPQPSAAVKAAPQPRKRAATQPRSAAPKPERVVNRRWTTPEALKPLILEVLDQAGGELDAEDFFGALEILAQDQLKPGDQEKTPEGELRWRYAARRARIALIDEGLMTKGRPGVWQLAPAAQRR